MAKDNALISRAQTGDEGAFTELMRAYYAFVYSIVIRIVKNPNDAEEIAQDTFLNAYRGLPQLEDTNKFKSWLTKIARNRSLNWLREQKIDTVSIDEVDEPTLQMSESPDECLIRDEQRELIRRAMETLSETDREIARSYYLDGASYDELIRAHGLSYKAISFRLSRAKQKLSMRLGHLLTGVFVSPITTLKQICSGGLTVMKVGTVPKITAGAVAIIVLAFIGTRQFISSRENPSPSVEVVTSTPNESANSVSQRDGTLKDAVAAPSRERKPQISAEEMEQIMEQIEDFFAKLDEADVQSGRDTTQLPTVALSDQDSESGDTDPSGASEDTGLSAEEVMNAYAEAFRNLDFESVSFLSTGRIREEWAKAATGDFPILHPAELAKLLDGLKDLPDLPVEMRQIAEQQMRSIEQEIRSGAFERKMRSVWLKSLSQQEVVRSEYVGDEFHFELGGPAPDMSEILGIEISDVIVPNTLFKMRKENSVWRVYDSETLD